MGVAESRFLRLLAWRTMGAPAHLKPIPPVSRLTGAIVRILGCNPGPMTLQGTNTYLIGTGSERLLIDTGEDHNTEYLQHLKGVLAEEKARISHILLTHWHHDHTGGLPGVLRSGYTVEGVKVMKLQRTGAEEVPKGVAYTFVRHGDALDIDGRTLRILHTPGHTDDHISILLEEERALFSGDCILGEGTAVFENLSTYLASLALLAETNPSIIYPAHGSMIENPAPVIAQYIRHRLDREQQILGQLQRVFPHPLTIDNLVTAIYPTLNMVLKRGAANNVKHQLEKLITDGKVERKGSGFRLLEGCDESSSKSSDYAVKAAL